MPKISAGSNSASQNKNGGSGRRQRKASVDSVKVSRRPLLSTVVTANVSNNSSSGSNSSSNCSINEVKNEEESSREKFSKLWKVKTIAHGMVRVPIELLDELVAKENITDIFHVEDTPVARYRWLNSVCNTVHVTKSDSTYENYMETA